MPSRALQWWRRDASGALDQLETAHRGVGGSGPGRRYATLQVNHAYAVMLLSQFQGYCRRLHSEAVDFLAANSNPEGVASVLRIVMVQGRKLDQGNPTPGNIGSDFARLGMNFWPQVHALDARNAGRQASLDLLAKWRNAIAHQDWSAVGNDPTLHLKYVQIWRRACNNLAKSFSEAVRRHLEALVGRSPW